MKPKHPLNLTQIIHEDLSTILTFAFSYASLQEMLENRFSGEWKYLRKTIDEIGALKAIRACVELAAVLRVLDDDQKMSDHMRELHRGEDFGTVTMPDGTVKPLCIRDITNKIMHAASLAWDFSTEGEPRLVCFPTDSDQWQRADVRIFALARFCGMLQH